MIPSPPPFRVLGAPGRLPVLISVPHAGCVYSAALLGASRLPASALGVLEDPLVDRLVEGAVAAGAMAIVANAPRAEIDLNRALDDLDPAMVSWPVVGTRASRRASAGLGLIPSRIAGRGAIWRRSLSPQEVERRIDGIYQPYHGALAAALVRMRARFGVAVLLDCHSMPPRSSEAPGIVLGDRYGVSCDAAFMRAAEAACRDRRHTTARNDPYAGGEIVERHGAPSAGIHALQVEIDRGLYLAADMRTPGTGFTRVAALIGAVVATLADTAMAEPLLVAAE